MLTRLVVLLAIVLGGRTADAQARAAPAATATADTAALLGDWELNVERSHYGPGVERRRRERFTCAPARARVACTIVGERADGRMVRGSFTVALDGSGAPVVGVPGVDEVRLRPAGPGVLDATFLLRGRPAFGYRAYRARDGRSLSIVTVDPVSRAVLTTVVVYDRRSAAGPG